MNDSEVIKSLTHRRKSMDSEYQLWEPHFRELRDAIMPSRGRFHLGENRKASTLNKRIVDSTSRKGLLTLKSGLMAGMTSPSRPWFKLGLHAGSDSEDAEVKAYLHESQRRMYEVLRGSNIYGTLDKCYGDLGLYGTFGGLVHNSFENVIHSRAFPMGLYRLAEDDEGRVNAMQWETQMTVDQVMKKFPEDKISQSVRNRHANNDLYGTVNICCAVETRAVRNPNSDLARDMPVAVYYWEKNVKNVLLEVSGLGTNGLLGPRWETCEGEVWSVSSPGMLALGDSIQLQQQHRDKATAIQMMYKPPLQGPPGAKRSFRYVPGTVSSMTTMDLQKQGVRAAVNANINVEHLMMDIQETQGRIKEAFFNDLFRMVSEAGISGVKDVTATAIAEMHEEKLLILGPVLESMNNSLLTPVIEATFHYMQEARILPEAPPALNGQPIKVEFIGLLAQAQKAIGLAAIERTIGFIGSVAQLRPDVLDKMDVDEAVDAFVDQVGPPPKMITTTKKANEVRKARAEAQQQAAMVEAAQPLAGAAKLISETGERGAEGLQQAAL